MMKSTPTSEIQPVMKAPLIRNNGFFVPDKINPRQMPGSTACAIASPTSDRLFKKVNDPTIAELAVSRMDPMTTYRIFGS